MQDVEPLEVQIPAVHHVNRAGFGNEQVEDIDVVQLPVGDVDEARDRATQIEQRMHLYGGLGRAEKRPRKNRQAQIDRGRSERIDRFGEFHSKALDRVQPSGLTDQHLCEGGVDAPVAGFVGVRQRRAPNRFVKLM